MAKVTGALLSLGAGGTIGKTITFSKWRGIAYVRQHVVPANPNTTGQQSTRNVFSMISGMWKILPTIAVVPWTTFATGRAFFNRNAYMGQNVEALRGDVVMDDFIGSPGARGGLPPLDMIPTTVAAGGIEVPMTEPVIPPGWALVSAQAMVFEDQDPAVAFAGTVSAGEDVATPFTVDFTGLPTVSHQVRGWLRWTKPDGQDAYSVALAAQIVVT